MAFVIIYSLSKELSIPRTRYTISQITKSEKIDFIKGTLIGTTCGILINIPFIFDLLKIEFPLTILIQAFPALFFITILTIMSVFRFVRVFAKFNMPERKKFLTDGMLISFTLVEFILFLSGYTEVFLPDVNPAFHN